jgi:DNA (cytosine-5)-methyltransferase 1
MPNNSSNNFTFIDLFSGIGGFHISLNNHGGDCLAFSEIDNDAISSYCENIHSANKEMNLGDITKINQLPKHDLLTAGVPCQSWSIAGRNLGFDDDRGQLWNDTIYLLKQSKPKAFIFENVKGLVDPRNADSFSYILERIKVAGYYAKYFVLNSNDYGVPQNRVRVFIVGFRYKKHYLKFNHPSPLSKSLSLSNLLNFEITRNSDSLKEKAKKHNQDLTKSPTSLTKNNRYNKYFLFNDIRNGATTIHSWDIIQTTKKQKEICYLLLKNRRKKYYGNLDGNPISLKHFKELNTSIKKSDINALIKLGILKSENYKFSIINHDAVLTKDEIEIIQLAKNKELVADNLKVSRHLKLNRVAIDKTIENLQLKKIIKCIEVRYDFKNTKISSGLFGVNRIFLPSSEVFSTLVASDTQDHISLLDLEALNPQQYKQDFIEKIYSKNNYRKITKKEACLMQGFNSDFTLPEDRKRWMKLLGNSVSIPVIDSLCKEIINTGIFKKKQ